MRVIVCENYEDMSSAAAKIVAAQIILKPDSVLGLATGSTPVGMYNCLAQMNKNGEIDFSEVKTFNLDEYYPIDASNNQSYRYFMNENLFFNINIKNENTHVLNGKCTSPDEECENFEKMINEHGGIDLQVLGIGQNGHIGFNEPGANLFSKTHLTDLTESTINANSRFFLSDDEVPRQALTMGIGTILRAKKIIILASGAGKHNVVSELINGNINTNIPASMLKVHSDVILICDRAAYACDRIGIDLGGTEMKFGVINNDNRIIYKESIPSVKTDEDSLIETITDKCKEIAKKYNIGSVGIGTPGIIKKGNVSAVNLPLHNTPLRKIMHDALKLPVSVGKDADCAALGEAICGAGKNADNILMITLGTGIGGGIVINKSIYRGAGGAGEIGHICIEKGGRECRCGQRGCWEQYASVTALIKAAQAAAEENKDSVLYKLYEKNREMNGKVFFSAVKEGCPVAKKVLCDFCDYLAIGIKSLIYVFAPDMIVLSGGITNAGEDLLKPIVEKIDTDVPIKISCLKNDAGIVGASMLY